MLKKVFILPQFGRPHEWTQEYLAHIRTLAPYGWYWLILTPHPYESFENVTIVPMSLEDFNARVLAVTGVTTGNHLDERGHPVKLLSDYYPAFGDLFADLLTDCDYWSAANWDMIYGRLDHFLSDAQLRACDLWSDDYRHINSIFCFYQNSPRINQLYRQHPQWPAAFVYDGRSLCGFDELHFDPMVRALAAAGDLVFGHPPYFAYHSYDRLVQHTPVPNLTMAPDGALLECFDDDFPLLKNYAPWRGFIGREIAYFHFIRTKAWPMLRPYPQDAPCALIRASSRVV